ncbi:MAG: hypothetical protein HWE16_09440 [Gammaproteobacteria bacterium]|nr:hypothetical protein [Gammaproteobacteria bacterium]
MMAFAVGAIVLASLYPSRERFIERSKEFDSELNAIIKDYNIDRVISITYKPLRKPWFGHFKTHEHQVILYREAGLAVYYVYIKESLLAHPQKSKVVVNRKIVDI